MSSRRWNRRPLSSMPPGYQQLDDLPSMRIQIAGTAHADPLGQDRLKGWLEDLQQTHYSRPRFVGVEWDEDILRQVIEQRLEARARIMETWPECSGRFLDALIGAIAYEADAHLHVFPSAPILWLEAGRTDYDPVELAEFARFRAANYRKIYDKDIGGFGLEQLETMSRNAWMATSCGPPSTRDQTFASRIRSNYPPHESEWGIVIVGACHALPEDGRMRNLLEDKGFTCRSTFLHPDNLAWQHNPLE